MSRHANSHAVENCLALFLDGYLIHEIAQNLSLTERQVRSYISGRGYNPDRYSYDEHQIEVWVAMYR